ncbi:hypothetical protein ACROYT_G014845 [Oculina patagonica]
MALGMDEVCDKAQTLFKHSDLHSSQHNANASTVFIPHPAPSSQQRTPAKSKADKSFRQCNCYETSTALTTVDTAPTVTTPAVATATVPAAVTGATDAPAEESRDMDLEIPFVPTDTPEPMPTPSTPSSSGTLLLIPL